MKKLLFFIGVMLMLAAIPRVWAQFRYSMGYGLQTSQQTIHYSSEIDPKE